MAIISFQFNSINAQRNSGVTGNVSIKNGVNIKDATKTKLALGPQGQDVLRVTFEFTSTYEPKIGHITLAGELIHLDTPEKIEALTKAWQKDKHLPKEDLRVVMNHILSRCNVEAIIVSRDIGLPSPIELPRLSK